MSKSSLRDYFICLLKCLDTLIDIVYWFISIQTGFSIFSHNILSYLPVLSRSKWTLSRFWSRQFLVWKTDAKGILRLQKHKTWNKLFQYNIQMLYILSFQVLFIFPTKVLVLFRFSHFYFGGERGKFQPISGPGQIKFKSSGFPGFQVPLGTLLKVT